MEIFRIIGKIYISAVILMAITMTGSTYTYAISSINQEEAPFYCNGEVIVKFRSQGGLMRARRMAVDRRHEQDTPLSNTFTALGVHHTVPLMKDAPAYMSSEDYGLERVCLLRFDTTMVASVDEAIARLNLLDEVEIAEPNYLITLQPVEATVEAVPQAARFEEQWGLKAMRMDELWQKPIINTKRPVIAIVDTGVDTTHPELKDNIAEGAYDIVADTTIVSDPHGHGTHCAGIAAARGIQVCGANPNALIMPITVISPQGTGSVFNIMLGILKAVKNGADIISLSLGGSYNSMLYKNVIKSASEKAIVVAAAGNEGYCMHYTHRDLHGMATPRYANIPAAYGEVIGIMGTQEDGRLASWSNFDCDGPLRTTNEMNWGYQLRVPGRNILSTLPDGKYGFMSGTSMATPMAAGAISRLLQCRNFTSRQEMLRALIMTTHGCVDLTAAYEADERTLHPGTFVENIDGVEYTFVETSDSTAQMGDGSSPAANPEAIPSELKVPDEVRGLSVTTLATGCLKGATKLKTVMLGRSVENIGEQVFAGCTALAELAFDTRFPPSAPKLAFDYSHYYKVTLRNARGYAENYKTVSPWKDFVYWSELDLATGNRFWEVIDNRNTQMSFILYSKEQGMLQVGDGERAVDSLRTGSLTIPEKVRGYEVVIIGNDAFHNNNLLTEIILPTTLRNIFDKSFEGCKKINEIKLPYRVSYLGTRAFAACWELKTLHLSKSLETIGTQAFAECHKLRTIYMPKAEPPKLENNVFMTSVSLLTDGNSQDSGGEVYANATLYVPYGSKIKYATADGWKLFKHIEEMGFEDIEDVMAATPENTSIYDLTGRRLSTSTNSTMTLRRGIYIINGRKVVKI